MFDQQFAEVVDVEYPYWPFAGFCDTGGVVASLLGDEETAVGLAGVPAEVLAEVFDALRGEFADCGPEADAELLRSEQQPARGRGELIGVPLDRVFAADVAAFGGENVCCDSPELFGVEVAERVNEFAGDRVGVAGPVAFGVSCVLRVMPRHRRAPRVGRSNRRRVRDVSVCVS